MDGSAQTLRLNDYHYLGYAWKAGKVHSMCVATSEEVAHSIATKSLQGKPSKDEVFTNIEQLIRPMKMKPTVFSSV
jgi:hypothetical protein